MKVNTDGVLLAAWTAAQLPCLTDPGALRILDVGTGTGFMALMLAQAFPGARVEAVEIAAEAAREAAENFARSPWAPRLRVFHADFTCFVPESPYRLVVSNPPFFTDSLVSAKREKAVARHTPAQTRRLFFARVSRILDPGGWFFIILPADQEAEAEIMAESQGMRLRLKARVRSRENSKNIRVLSAFEKTEAVLPAVPVTQLTLYNADNSRHGDYAGLTQAYYL